MSLISPAETAEIEKTIARIEGKTSMELVVAVVERSHDYAAPRALFAFGWTLATRIARPRVHIGDIEGVGSMPAECEILTVSRRVGKGGPAGANRRRREARGISDG